MKTLFQMQSATAALYALLSFLSVTRAETLTGHVFLDRNTNGVLDLGEPGIPGVLLTDGIQFVRTDSSGAYQIEMAKDPTLRDGGIPILSVSFPTGYWPTSPWFKRTTERQPRQQVDFGLRQDTQSLPFTFVHATDPHVPRKGTNMFIGFRQDVRELADQVKFCILTGDEANQSDKDTLDQATSDYKFFAEQTREFPVPLFCISGNHDMAGVNASPAWDKGNSSYAYGLYSQYVGPLRWSFNFAGIHLAGIDFNRFGTNKWYWGVPDEAVRWLESDLKQVAPGTRIFLFVHFLQGPPELAEVVQKYHVTQIFHGHDHQDRQSVFATVKALSSSSLSEIFQDKDRKPGYRLVRVTENGIETFYRETGNPHAITIDRPRGGTNHKRGQEVQGAFYDPQKTITSLTIKIGEVEEKVAFERGDLACRFTAKLNLDSVPEGAQTLTVSVTDGQKSWKVSAPIVLKP